MHASDWLAAIPADDVRYPIARVLLDYEKRRKAGWSPAQLMPQTCAFGLRDGEKPRT